MIDSWTHFPGMIVRVYVYKTSRLNASERLTHGAQQSRPFHFSILLRIKIKPISQENMKSLRMHFPELA